MSFNKNKTEIVESFKNLLKKADEVKKLETDNNLIDVDNEKVSIVDVPLIIENSSKQAHERLGIKSIERVPGRPLKKHYKLENKEKYEKFEYEVTIKIQNILNRHLYHWLNRELPRYSKTKLRKYIYEVLNQLVK